MNKIKRKLFSMESILDSRIIDEQLFYLIKWAGYPISQSTWEKAEKVPIDCELVEEYKFNVKMVGKSFYFDPLDQPPQIEDFVEVPQPKSELSTFNTQLATFQKQINYLRDDVRKILQMQLLMMKDLKQSKISSSVQDYPRSPNSQDKPISIKSELQCAPNTGQSLNVDGSFEQGDRVDKIGRAVQIKIKKIKMYYILWKKRPNGQIPKNSWVESEQLKEYDPIKLCRYLWTKLI